MMESSAKELIAEIDAELERWYDGGNAVYPHALLQRCRAALQEAVPREPTEAMVEAATMSRLPHGMGIDIRQAIWRATYDAAIQSSESEEGR